MRRRQKRPAALPASGSGLNVGVISQLRTNSYYVGLSHVGSSSILANRAIVDYWSARVSGAGTLLERLNSSLYASVEPFAPEAILCK